MKQLHLVFVFVIVFVFVFVYVAPGLHGVPAPVVRVLREFVEGEKETELAVVFF